ncbi:hypothetical protein RUND412_001533 [Rhizina undulata]
MTGPITPNRTRIRTPRRESSPDTPHPADDFKGLVPVGKGFCLFTPKSISGDPFAIPQKSAKNGKAAIAAKNKAFFLKKRNIRFPRLYKEVCGLHITPYYQGYGSVGERSPVDMLVSRKRLAKWRVKPVKRQPCKRSGKKRAAEDSLEEICGGLEDVDGASLPVKKKLRKGAV